ncbi:hypothetical protein I5G62_gp80 [Mycobacterium phage CRB2]|uniref:Uncharacterized protein n=1 Tax=Mycobacterium phage CRB2 TaxID=2483623 RepID=A0A455LM38_9CAUD|nr:hypothetical protein I5G62_gp80 [Mycobacterium phage CRB2]AYP70066.1 hypothetical protein CRB2_80 [Mycobacterium phage CRB2]
MRGWLRRGRHRPPRGPLGYWRIIDGRQVRMVRPVRGTMRTIAADGWCVPCSTAGRCDLDLACGRLG